VFRAMAVLLAVLALSPGRALAQQAVRATATILPQPAIHELDWTVSPAAGALELRLDGGMASGGGGVAGTIDTRILQYACITEATAEPPAGTSPRRRGGGCAGLRRDGSRAATERDCDAGCPGTLPDRIRVDRRTKELILTRIIAANS
jgi:hypothetical protein